MSLIYNEFEGSDKNGNDEELKIEKMDLDTKKPKRKKRREKRQKRIAKKKKNSHQIQKKK